MNGSDAVLVDQARKGSTEAYRALVERHAPAVFRLAFHLTSHRSDAEDVVQEAFLRAHRAIANFESRSGFGTWLHRIAKNCAFDLLRKRKRAKDLEDSINGIHAPESEWNLGRRWEPDRPLLDGEFQSVVDGELARMSELERTAFLLRHVEGQSTAEISEVLEKSPEATKQAVFRAVRRLRAALRPHVGAER